MIVLDNTGHLTRAAVLGAIGCPLNREPLSESDACIVEERDDSGRYSECPTACKGTSPAVRTFFIVN